MHYADVIVRGENVLSKLLSGDCPNSALVITGGGFQGIRSAGMCCTLENLGLTDSFDAAYGTSAGSANVAYFLSCQTTLGASVYYEDLVDRNYASVFSWPIVNMDFLTYEMMGRRKALDVKRIYSSKTKFYIPLTTLSGGCEFVQVNREVAPILQVLRAGMSITVWCGAPSLLNRSRYYDGMMTEPIPFRRAIQDGYNNVLVLLNMPFQWDDETDNFLLRLLKRPLLRKESAALRACYFRRQERYREQLRDLLDGRLPRGVNLTAIAPSMFCSRLPFYTRNAQLLKQGAEEGVMIVGEITERNIPVPLL